VEGRFLWVGNTSDIHGAGGLAAPWQLTALLQCWGNLAIAQKECIGDNQMNKQTT